MRSPTCIFICVLGFLSSLSMAGQPVFSTVETPFTLQSGRPESELFNVVLKFNTTLNVYSPILTQLPVPIQALPTFKLTNGNLTSSDGSLGAFFLDSDFTPGTLLRPIRFGTNVPQGALVFTPDFVVNTFFSPGFGSNRQLISLNGGM